MEQIDSTIKISTSLPIMFGGEEFMKPIWVKVFGDNTPEVKEWRQEFLLSAIDEDCSLKDICEMMIEQASQGELFPGRQLCSLCPCSYNEIDSKKEELLRKKMDEINRGQAVNTMFCLCRAVSPESMETLLTYPEKEVKGISGSPKIGKKRGRKSKKTEQESAYFFYIGGENKPIPLGKGVTTIDSAMKSASTFFGRTKKNFSLLQKKGEETLLLASFFMPDTFLLDKNGEYLAGLNLRTFVGSKLITPDSFKLIPTEPVVVKKKDREGQYGRRPSSWLCEIFVHGHRLELFFGHLSTPGICGVLSALEKDCKIGEVKSSLSSGKEEIFDWRSKLKSPSLKTRKNRELVELLVKKTHSVLESFGIYGVNPIPEKGVATKKVIKPNSNVSSENDSCKWEICFGDKSVIQFEGETPNAAAALTRYLVQLLSLDKNVVFLKRNRKSGEPFVFNWRERLLSLSSIEEKALEKDSFRLKQILENFPMVKDYRTLKAQKDSKPIPEPKPGKVDIPIKELANVENNLDTGLLETALAFGDSCQIDEIFELLGIISVMQTSTRRFLELFERTLSEEQGELSVKLKELLSRKLIQLAEKVKA